MNIWSEDYESVTSSALSLRVHDGPITSVKWSRSDSTTLATAGFDAKICIWKAAAINSRIVQTYTAPSAVADLSWKSNEPVLAASTSKKHQVSEPETSFARRCVFAF